jgi:hypothetical protein
MRETEDPRSVVCYEELSLAISCREAEKLSYLVRMLKGSDDDYDGGEQQKAQAGRDKKRYRRAMVRERCRGMKQIKTQRAVI